MRRQWREEYSSYSFLTSALEGVRDGKTKEIISFLNFPLVHILIHLIVVLGGLVVIVLATRPKIREFKTVRGRWIFQLR
jgi:hypothetical protein